MLRAVGNDRTEYAQLEIQIKGNIKELLCSYICFKKCLTINQHSNMKKIYKLIFRDFFIKLLVKREILFAI
jgi:hypothetical protein